MFRLFTFLGVLWFHLCTLKGSLVLCLGSLWIFIVATLISQFKLGNYKMINKLINILNVCVCHEWTWLNQLFESGEVMSSKPLA